MTKFSVGEVLGRQMPAKPPVPYLKALEEQGAGCAAGIDAAVEPAHRLANSEGHAEDELRRVLPALPDNPVSDVAPFTVPKVGLAVASIAPDGLDDVGPVEVCREHGCRVAFRDA